MPTRRLLRLAATSTLLACAGMASAGIAAVRAEVRLSGTQDQMMLEARNASMPEIVAGMESALGVRIKLTGSTPRQFTGVYTGSMRRVLSRLLNGLDHLVRPTDGGLDVAILAPTLDRPHIAAAAAPARAGTNGPVRVAAISSDESGAQGWVPTQDPFRAARMAAAQTIPAAPATAPAAPANPAAAASDGDDALQGWIPTQDPYAAARAAAAKDAARNAPPAAVPAARPSASATASDGDDALQGWIPTQDLYAAAREAAAKAAAQKAPDAKPRSRAATLMDQIGQATAFPDEPSLELATPQDQSGEFRSRRTPSLAPSLMPSLQPDMVPSRQAD